MRYMRGFNEMRMYVFVFELYYVYFFIWREVS